MASSNGKKHFCLKYKSLPRRGTRAAASFFQSWEEIQRFYHLVLHLIGHIELTAANAHKVLVEFENDPEKRTKLIDNWKKRKSPLDELKRNRQIFIEIMLVRHTENFLNFLSSLLYESFVQKPETLRSSDKVEISNVLRHDSIDSLVHEMAKRKVESLSYSSFREINQFFFERFHIHIASDVALAELSEAIEIRNISVHNRCIIDHRFVSRLGLKQELIGQKKELFVDTLDQLVPLLAEAAKELDRKMCSKLGLKGVRFDNFRKKANTSEPPNPRLPL